MPSTKLEEQTETSEPTIGAGHNDTAAIEIRELTKVYGGKIHPIRAVDRISLSIPAGQVFGFLGPNGAGKTTTIKMMCGLVTPTSGSVRLNGYDVGKQRSAAVMQLGAVLEGSRNVYWSLSAWQNLTYFGRLKGLRDREIKPRAEQLLRELGLWDRRNELVGSFSRGMQQKVAVAAALITDPPILLLDEPTIGLDVQAAHTVKVWIMRLAHEEGKTVVLTTHQLGMAQELADRVAIIRDGRIGADLPVDELLARFREDRYRITLRAPLEATALHLPEGASVAHENGVSTLTAPVRDQHELYDLLDQLRKLDVALESVTQVEPDLEEVFIRILEGSWHDN